MEQIPGLGSRREYFTQVEAEALVGSEVKTRKAWPGVPEGTSGTVVSADPSTYGWTVGIRWHLSTDLSMPTLEVDWFTRHEFQLWMEKS
jgi:hypothetical protein